MCVLIDVNTIPAVFNSKCTDHPEFCIIYDWLMHEEKARFVYGGSKYKEELKKLASYFAYLVELKKSGKMAEVDDQLVDIEECKLRAKCPDEAFNDAHIVAILIVSTCRLFCSNDKRADKYIKMKALYPKGHKRPSIYRGTAHAHLLCADNLITIRNVKN